MVQLQESSELLEKVNSLKGRSDSKKKRQRFGSQKRNIKETTVINVTQFAQDENAQEEEKDPIIRNHSHVMSPSLLGFGEALNSI